MGKNRAVKTKTLVPVYDGTDPVIYFFVATAEQVIVTGGQPDVTTVTVTLYRRKGDSAPQAGGIFGIQIFFRTGGVRNLTANGAYTIKHSDVDFTTIKKISFGFYNGTAIIASKDVSFNNDAVPSYTWHKYADSVGVDGFPTSIYDDPKPSTRFVGFAFNKNSDVESEVPEDYEWVELPKGEPGTSFVPKGKAYGHFLTAAQCQANPDRQSGCPYLVDSENNGAPYLYTLYGSRWGSLEAEEDDAYIIEETGRIWIAKGDKWVDFGSIQGPKGDDGEDAVNWNLMVSPKVIRWDGLGTSASQIQVKSYRSKGSSAATLTAPYQIRVGKNYRNGRLSPVQILHGSSNQIDISSEASVLESIEISLEILPSVIIARETVTFVRELNRMVIPEGVWDETISYQCTEIKSPLVMEGNNYYYMVYEGTSTGVRPSESAAEGGIWRLADKYNLVITQAIMANFAKLSAAVFYGDYMFSQYGNGGTSAAYGNFVPSNPMGNNTWIPDFLIDFLKGEMYAAGGKVAFKKDGSGFLAGGKVSWGADGNPNIDGKLSVRSMTLKQGEWIDKGDYYIIDQDVSPGTIFFTGFLATELDKPRYMPLAYDNIGLELTFLYVSTTRMIVAADIETRAGEFFYIERGGTLKRIGLKTVTVMGSMRCVAVNYHDFLVGWLITSFTGTIEGRTADGSFISIKDNLLIT